MSLSTTIAPEYPVIESGLTTNRTVVSAGQLNEKRPVYIVVTAHLGNSSCSSANTTVTLKTRVKLPAPQTVSASWSDRKLNLTWRGQGELASVDVLVRRLDSATQTWTNAVPLAAQVGGVNYTLTDPQHGCRCPDKKKLNGQTTGASTKHSIYVTHSAVNLSFTAINTAGSSAPRYVHVRAAAKDLKACENHKLLIDKVPKGSCVEWYEFKGEEMKEHVRYSYLEHRCVQGIPQTVEMCLRYKKEGVPLVKPLSFISMNVTESSVDLSWLSIPPEDQHGFLTHYALCYTTTNQSQDQKHTGEECHNLTGSQTHFHLEKLKPHTHYTISLAGVTSMGPGPKAILIVNTFILKQQTGGNFLVWISLGLLTAVFGALMLCILLVKRFPCKILPPIPEVILLYPLNPAANQEELEQREQGDEVSVTEPVLKESGYANTIIGTDEDQTQRGSRDSFESPVDQEEVLYRNGLVFDMKTEED
ncbi:unnamed protein product [Merluccius merluccius]